MSTTTRLIEESLERWYRDRDAEAFNQLVNHAHQRMCVLCRIVGRRELPRNHSWLRATDGDDGKVGEKIALNSEIWTNRMKRALESTEIRLATAKDFFQLATWHIEKAIYDSFRRDRKHSREVQGEFTAPTADRTADQILEGAELAQRLFAARDELLSEEDREVFNLRYVNGLKRRETAEALGRESEEIHTACDRIKRKLGADLGSLVDGYQNKQRCEHCGREFRTTGERDRHQQLPHSHECPYPGDPRQKKAACTKRFTDEDALDAHLRETHFRCDYCDQWCRNKTSLKQHEEDVHFKCPHPDCYDDCFTDAGALSHHKVTVHFICPRCNKQFGSQAKLEQHRSQKGTCVSKV